ncbi:MAG: CBS domain-containing protein [Methylococcaceae bacterium]|nr:CBS domain-containing protein [Methylococcaceae bacterium]
MNDDQPPSSHSPHKSWIGKLSQLLSGEPQDQEELLDILREAQENHLLDSYALSMIEGVLRVAEMRVRDIMIPRVQMVVVAKDENLEAIFPLVIESAHSRFPVIAEDRSKVVGILLAKDLLTHALDHKVVRVENIMRPVSVVPESKRLNVLLKEFRSNRNHMAIVVDEYGATAGLVTIEDVLEQIVGEIEDEHDDFDDEVYIRQRNDHEYTIQALTPIEEFNAYFSTSLSDEAADTIGGFILHELQHMPKKGEHVEVDHLRFEVMRADSRRVHLLKLKMKGSKLAN